MAYTKHFSLLLTFVCFFILSGNSFANDEVPVCDCPGLESLSGQMQEILNFVVSADPALASDHELLTSIDELTLVSDITFSNEADTSICSSTSRLIDREPIDPESLNELISAHPSVLFNGRISLGDFDPSFLRLTSENQRMLMLRGEVAGEIRYFVLHIDEEGIARVNVYESIDEILPRRVIPAIDFRLSDPSIAELSALTPAEVTPLPRAAELSFSSSETGFNFGVAGETDEQLEYNWTNRFSVMSTPSATEEGVRDVQRLSFGSTIDLAVEPSENLDYTLRARGSFDSGYNQYGDGGLEQGQIGLGVTVPNESREFTGDLTFDLNRDPNLRLSYSNFGSNQVPLNQAREALRITPPQLSFGGRIAEQSAGAPAAAGASGGKGGGSTPQPETAAEQEGEPDDVLFSLEASGTPEGVERLQFSVVDLRGERPRSLDAVVDVPAEQLNLTGAISLPEDQRLSFAGRFSDERGNDVLLLYQRVTTETNPDGSIVERRLTPQLFWSDQDFNPSRVGLDYVQINREGADRQVATHLGVTYYGDERLELRAGREITEGSLTGAPGPVRRQSFIGTASIDGDDYEVFVVARDYYQDRFGEGEGLGIEAYMSEHGGDRAAQMSVEGIIVRDGGERSYSCSLGVRFEEGPSSRRPAAVPAMHRGAEESVDCELLLTRSASGELSHSIGLTYARRMQNGGELYGRMVLDTSPEARDRVQFHLGTQVRR